jgi:amidase
VIDRRRFLVLSAAAGATAAVAQVPQKADATDAPRLRPFDLEEATIADLGLAMAEGRWSSVEITEMYLRRIAEVDRPGGAVGLNSMIELNPDALAIAAERDRERKEGRVRGPLHGVPIAIKDNIDTADRMKTTAGSLALAGSTPARDAFVVERLREAGAVILGKTNLSEWANFRSTKSSSGWSARGGQTNNPYALDRNPCGSSSGSGAAVAANLAAAAVGTETDGSIVCPSSANGIVGLKPTIGLVSRSGIVPISHSQDTAGPMARTVADAATLLGVLAGTDPRDGETKKSERKRHDDYTKFLDRDGLEGARIGVARKSLGFNPRVDEAMKEALEVMKRRGAVIVDPADLPTHGKFDEAEFTVLLYEFKHDLNAYLASLPPSWTGPRTLKELIEFNEKNAAAEMPYFGQEIFHMAEAKGPLTEKAYLEARESSLRLAGPEGIDAIMKKEKLDALVAPTGGPAWTTDLVNGDHYSGGYSSASAIAGYPHVTVPLGEAYGLPFGISFFGGAWSEPTLIRLAYAFEQATQARKAPEFLARPDLSVDR